jgi:hypothetical protein
VGSVHQGLPPNLARDARRAVGARTLVETGTNVGNSAALAARMFERVVTIEKDPTLHATARARYGDLRNVEWMLGDSRDILPQLDLSEPTVFWLDGHWSAGDTAGEGDECPLLEELATIGPRHAILIDDARLFIEPPPPPHDPSQWPTLEQVMDALRDREVAIRDDVVMALPRQRRSRWLLGLWRLVDHLAHVGPRSTE